MVNYDEPIRYNRENVELKKYTKKTRSDLKLSGMSNLIGNDGNVMLGICRSLKVCIR